MFDNYRACAVAAGVAIVLGWSGPAAIIYVLDHPRPSDAGTLGALVREQCAPDRKVVETDLTTALTCQDLAAQASMGRSTNGLHILGWLQLVVSVLGTAFLLISLRETRKATRLTRLAVESQVEVTKLTRAALEHQVKALEHQQDIDKSTLRARVGSRCITTERTDKTPLRLRMEFSNHGQTNARQAQFCYIWKVVDGEPLESALEDCPRDFDEPGILQKGQTSHSTVRFSTADALAFQRGEKCVHIAMFGIYEDEFGGQRKVARCERRTGPSLGLSERLKGYALPTEFKGRAV
ncbi:MAG TPA: hypothetical protein VN018_02840 [Brevundimonas sp.]|nr:hypothetical protein [Brevundimonas sp.]